MSRDYYAELKQIIDDGYGDYRAKLAEYNKLKKERESGHITSEKLYKDIQPKMTDLKVEMSSIKDRVLIKAQGITAQIKQDDATADRLDPSELTADAELLNGSQHLTQSDVEGIIARNPGNKTMKQMAIRYAQEHGIHVNYVYEPTKTDTASIDGAVNLLVSRFDSDNEGIYQNVYNGVFSKGE